jgi:PAS domain S-box-containing protein
VDGTTAIIAAAAAALGSILSMVGKFVIDLFTIKNKSDDLAVQRQFDALHAEREEIAKDAARLRMDLNQQIEDLRDQLAELHDKNVEFVVENAELRAKVATLEAKVREFEDGQLIRQARGIVETAVDAIVTINDKGIVSSFNPSAVKMFGYLPEEVLGQNVSLLMPRPDAKQHNQYIDHYLRTGEARIIGIGRRVTAKRKNDSRFVIDLAISEVQIEGERHFTGIARYVREGSLDESTGSQEATHKQLTKDDT